jgi:hypothetical protein
MVKLSLKLRKLDTRTLSLVINRVRYYLKTHLNKNTLGFKVGRKLRKSSIFVKI